MLPCDQHRSVTAGAGISTRRSVGVDGHALAFLGGIWAGFGHDSFAIADARVRIKRRVTKSIFYFLGRDEEVRESIPEKRSLIGRCPFEGMRHGLFFQAIISAQAEEMRGGFRDFLCSQDEISFVGVSRDGQRLALEQGRRGLPCDGHGPSVSMRAC